MIDFEEIKGKIRGPSVSIVTPFTDSNELNTEAVQEYIRFIIDGGISNGKGHLLCPGGVDQLVALSHEEHKRMVEAAVEVAGDELLVVAGVFCCNYREAIELANNAAEAGAKCVMIPPPYYYPVGQVDIYRWYKAIAEETEIGIMAYDQPWRTHTGGFISVSLMGKLTEIENMVSIKYAGGAGGLMDYITAWDLYSKRFAFIDNSGASTAAVAHMHGATGYISGTGAFWPEFEAKYWSLLEQRKYEEAAKWRTKLSPLAEFQRSEDAAGIGGGARYLKTALEYVGLYGGPARLPFIELTKEQKNKFFGVLEGIGVPKKR